jgi:hypothetical protein
MLQTKCCKRPTNSIDSELSRDLWLRAHLSSFAFCITYGGYWNLSVFNLFLHGTSCTKFCVLCALRLSDTIIATMLLLCQLIRFIDNQGLHLLAGLGFRGSLSVSPSSGLIGPPVPQQVWFLIRSVAASEPVLSLLVVLLSLKPQMLLLWSQLRSVDMQVFCWKPLYWVSFL